MKLRTQLIVAFLFLAVVPLASIVLYSYLSSQRAFRRAVEAETWVLAEEIGDRMAGIRRDMEELAAELGSLPVHLLVTEGEKEPGAVYTELVSRIGEVSTFVEWFAFIPVVGGAGEGGCDCEETFLVFPSEALARALKKLDRYRGLDPRASEMIWTSLEPILAEAIRPYDALSSEELAAIEATARSAKDLLGADFRTPMFDGGNLVGHLEIQVRPSPVLRHVLSRTRRDDGEIPFAFDPDGRLFVADPADKKVLKQIAQQTDGVPGSLARAGNADWIFAETEDPASILTFGIARPIRASLQEMRRTAATNFGAGLAMMVVALVAIHLLSRRLTRDLDVVTVGAERLAGGDLDVRLPELSGHEIGRLARTFNRMAFEIREKEKRLLEEEERRKEQDIRQRLLAAENARKTGELEEARQLQLSLLPKDLPTIVGLDVAVAMRTATEVGGDYYDFFTGPGGALTVAIGDATGHGARAGTLVTAVKGLLSLGAGSADLAEFLADAGGAVQRMGLLRMSMALMLLRLEGSRLDVSSAGMPPLLLRRAEDEDVEEVCLVGTPLGAMSTPSYERWQGELGQGDALLLMSDGFPELLGHSGEPLGYERALTLFQRASDGSAQEIVDALTAAAEEWNGGEPPNDDITFVVLKRQAARGS